jgi:DNA polymerase epsilon subunit 1
MYAMKVNVNRTIYINSKIETNDFKKVQNKILPRNRKIYNLYEWETSEEEF